MTMTRIPNVALAFLPVLTAQLCGISLRRFKLPAMLAGLVGPTAIEALKKWPHHNMHCVPGPSHAMSRPRHTCSRDLNKTPSPSTLPYPTPFQIHAPPGPAPPVPRRAASSLASHCRLCSNSLCIRMTSSLV